MKPINWRASLLTFLQFFTSCTFLLFFSSTALKGQHTVEVRIDEGFATTTCTDFLSTPDPLWEVSIEREDWVTYGDDLCFTSVPNLQFTVELACLGDLKGGEIEICFRAFENDAGFTPCNVNGECIVSICENVVLPLPGQDSSYVLALKEGDASGGEVRFTIAVSGVLEGASNDHICHAIDLGTLSENTILGKAELGNYNNYCATAIEEVNPKDIGGSFTNNVGTWFSFTTGNTTNKLVIVEAISDPEETGDFINLQLALYRSDNDACNGNLIYLTDHHDPADFDEYMILECLEPNQQYYILVDGVYDEEKLPELQGVHSLRIREAAVIGENDRICDAISLEVAEGDTRIYSDFFNNCATDLEDPKVDDFPAFKPVWFQFSPPATHRVQIEVISNLPFPNGIDPIEPQLAIFKSADNTCSGELSRIAHHYSSNGGTNSLNLECLEPNASYWLMIDGSEQNPTGVFDIHITDPGYPDITKIDSTICEGSQLVLGNQIYSEAGIYLDTVIFETGCLEVIQTTIDIADSIHLAIAINKLAGGIDISDGVAEVIITGGSGNYNIDWSNGADTRIVDDLIGGTEYCIMVSDVIGCTRQICFTMPYVVPIDAQVLNDSLDCFGAENGQLQLVIENGQPPYQYLLQNAANEIIESGSVEDQAATVLFPNLIAGNYKVTVFTNNAITEMVGKIATPTPISIQVNEQANASCFGICDAMVDLRVTGGSGDFTFLWQDGIERGATSNELCSGNYQLTITDRKKCAQPFNFIVTEPREFIAQAVETAPVQCFGAANGQASVSANEPPIAYQWDNGETTIKVDDLAAGEHFVVVTNADDCIDTTFFEITEPLPITPEIEVLSTINCFGDANGLLKANATGGNGAYIYRWSNDITTALNDNLPTGNYALTVSDLLGCTAQTEFLLEQPASLSATLTTRDVTCPGGPRSGQIVIENTTGGVVPFGYSLDGKAYTTINQFEQLAADEYEVFVQDANGCEVAQTVMINNPPLLEVKLGQDQILQLGEMLRLEAQSNRPVQYEWNIADTLSCPNCPTLELQPMSSREYIVTVTDLESECVATDKVFVAIENNRDIYVPNAFSPNGDGQNDALMIYGGNDVQEIKAFKIFDRRGTLVYQANAFSPNDLTYSWKGDFNGQQLASGIYIYWAEVVFIDGYSDIYKGDIALLR